MEFATHRALQFEHVAVLHRDHLFGNRHRAIQRAGTQRAVSRAIGRLALLLLGSIALPGRRREGAGVGNQGEQEQNAADEFQHGHESNRC